MKIKTNVESDTNESDSSEESDDEDVLYVQSPESKEEDLDMSLASSDDTSEAKEDSDVDDVTMNLSFHDIFNAYVDETLQKVEVNYRSGGSKIYHAHDGRERRALRECVKKSTPGTSWETLPLKREGKQHSYTKGFDPG